MLKFALIEERENKVFYEYYPEGGSESGIVSFNKQTGDGSIETVADNDKHQRYAMKALKRIREMASNKSFEKEGMIAWY